MTRNDRIMRAIERRWIAQFGEPPTVLTDPDIMLAVLESEPPVRPRPPCAAPTSDHPQPGS